MKKSLIHFFLFVTFNSHLQGLFILSNTDICASYLQGNEMYDNITVHSMGRKICGLQSSLILMRISRDLRWCHVVSRGWSVLVNDTINPQDRRVKYHWLNNEWNSTGENQSTHSETYPSTIENPTWTGLGLKSRLSVVTGWQLTAWAMAQPCHVGTNIWQGIELNCIPFLQ